MRRDKIDEIKRKVRFYSWYYSIEILLGTMVIVILTMLALVWSIR
jgi:hypothetical protein